MNGCRLFVSADELVTVGSGPILTATIAIPAVAALAGAHLFVQGVVVDPTANAVGITMSSSLDATIGVR